MCIHNHFLALSFKGHGGSNTPKSTPNLTPRNWFASTAFYYKEPVLREMADSGLRKRNGMSLEQGAMVKNYEIMLRGYRSQFKGVPTDLI